MGERKRCDMRGGELGNLIKGGDGEAFTFIHFCHPVTNL
jgi:hypothetical protein